MSGTSLDGLDICYVRFDSDSSFEMLQTEGIDYSSAMKNQLKNAYTLSAMDLRELDTQFGYYLGEQVAKFIKKHHILNLDFVASHGQTIFHQPDKNFTLQIGNGAAIAAKCGQQVICDFRTQDVVLGGQGAPLVPIGDELLFNQYDACLNLGGFSNISMNRGGKRIAFDICPINIVLNYYANQLNLEYDKGGNCAAKGKLNQDLLTELDQLEFYKKDFPKSLGFEWVENEFLTCVDKYEISIEDKMFACVVHMVNQLSVVFKNHDINKVLITGGGAKNDLLIRLLSEFSVADLIIPEEGLIDFKEALIFAFLGYRKFTNQINCLSSVTGASKDHSSGVIYTI